MSVLSITAAPSPQPPSLAVLSVKPVAALSSICSLCLAAVTLLLMLRLCDGRAEPGQAAVLPALSVSSLRVLFHAKCSSAGAILNTYSGAKRQSLFVEEAIFAALSKGQILQEAPVYNLGGRQG